MTRTRRAFVGLGLRGLGLGSLVLGGGLAGPAALLGCSGDAARCYDPELLSTPEQALRRTRGYADRSPRPGDQECGGCQFFRSAPDSASPCGECSILGGPVDALGRCDAWTARTVG